MAARAGLKVLNVRMTEANGGSFQVMAARTSAPFRADTAGIDRILASEEGNGFNELEPYQAFRERVLNHRHNLEHIPE
jgi:hypothetical protein